MSNYTIENLIPATAGEGRVPAIKIGSQVFPMQTGGSSMDFYKCASVSSGTWTGYKAVFDSVSGTYSFEQSVTSGLTYTSVTPSVGKVYADGALIRAVLYEGVPIDGLVFYAPLASSQATAETGQALNQTAMTYSNVSGRACALFSGSSYINPANTDIPSGNMDHTISLNLYIGNDMDYRQVFVLAFGSDGGNTASTINTYSGKWAWCFGGLWDTTGVNYPKNQWFNVVRRYTASTSYNELFVNGSKVADLTRNCNISGNYFTIGSYVNNNTSESFIGNMFGVRIYNRALSDSEIAALASEIS